MPKHVLMVAGDPSGDQHGAALAKALKAHDPDLKISALGGAHLREVADTFVYPLVGVGGFGFFEPIFKIPRLFGVLRQIKDLLKKDRPAVVIPIDFYGFNIHIARAAHKQKIPVVYYISPQVWASRPGRIKELAKVLNRMLVIFPFEKTLYQKAGVPVEFVGHPLLDRMPGPEEPNGNQIIGLLPGSRRSIVERHLPIFLETAEALHTRLPLTRFILFRPQEIPESFYQPFLAKHPWIELKADPAYQLRKKLSLAISVSGTAALENTLLGIPMIVMYKLSPLTYAIARRLIRVPFIAIPNILAGKSVVPELIQADATPDKLAAAALSLLQNPSAIRRMRDDLLAQRAQLGAPGAVERAAQEVSRFL